MVQTTIWALGSPRGEDALAQGAQLVDTTAVGALREREAVLPPPAQSAILGQVCPALKIVLWKGALANKERWNICANAPGWKPGANAQ